MEIIYTIWLRNMKRYVRSKSRIIGSISMPLFFLLFLGFGLNSVVQMPGMGGDYIGFLIPGMVAMSVMFTSVFSGIQVIWDKQFGFLKETLVAPVSRLEIMLGQTAGGASTAVLQGFMILVISLFIGLQISSVIGFLVALLFMVLIHLPDIRPLRGALPDQLTTLVDNANHAHGSPDLRGGRDPVRPDRGVPDQPGGLFRRDRGVLSGHDGDRSIPLQEYQDITRR